MPLNYISYGCGIQVAFILVWRDAPQLYIIWVWHSSGFHSGVERCHPIIYHMGVAFKWLSFWCGEMPLNYILYGCGIQVAFILVWRDATQLYIIWVWHSSGFHSGVERCHPIIYHMGVAFKWLSFWCGEMPLNYISYGCGIQVAFIPVWRDATQLYIIWVWHSSGFHSGVERCPSIIYHMGVAFKWLSFWCGEMPLNYMSYGCGIQVAFILVWRDAPQLYIIWVWHSSGFHSGVERCPSIIYHMGVAFKWLSFWCGEMPLNYISYGCGIQVAFILVWRDAPQLYIIWVWHSSGFHSGVERCHPIIYYMGVAFKWLSFWCGEMPLNYISYGCGIQVAFILVWRDAPQLYIIWVWHSSGFSFWCGEMPLNYISYGCGIQVAFILVWRDAPQLYIIWVWHSSGFSFWCGEMPLNYISYGCGIQVAFHSGVERCPSIIYHIGVAFKWLSFWCGEMPLNYISYGCGNQVAFHSGVERCPSIIYHMGVAFKWLFILVWRDAPQLYIIWVWHSIGFSFQCREELLNYGCGIYLE